MSLYIEPSSVYLVLDPEFGSGIDKLIDLGTIYMEQSETNDLAIKRYKKLHPDRERLLGIVTLSAPFRNAGIPHTLPKTLVLVADDMRKACEVTMIGLRNFERSMSALKKARFRDFREGFYNGYRTIVVVVHPHKRWRKLTLIKGGKSN